jgi:hypothetical protein
MTTRNNILSVPPGLRLFHRGDLDGFFALGLDNMLMLILMSNFCLGFPLYMPRELFFERILPAAALGLVIGNLYYARQAWRLAQQEGRSDVCALPFGINIITLIAFVFLVLYPAKFIGEAQGLTGDDVAIFAGGPVYWLVSSRGSSSSSAVSWRRVSVDLRHGLRCSHRWRHWPLFPFDGLFLSCLRLSASRARHTRCHISVLFWTASHQGWDPFRPDHPGDRHWPSGCSILSKARR